jgi:hypothetical protein
VKHADIDTLYHKALMRLFRCKSRDVSRNALRIAGWHGRSAKHLRFCVTAKIADIEAFVRQHIQMWRCEECGILKHECNMISASEISLCKTCANQRMEERQIECE